MTLVVLVILAAIWVLVLVPPLLRARTQRTNDSIDDFNHRLDVLGRTNGALRVEAMRVPPAMKAARRRRDVLRSLVVAVVVTGLLGLATNIVAAWVLHALADVALLAFCGLWAWVRSVELERVLKVRPLGAPARAELPLRRAASS